ncbi:MAG TPA: alpha-amylase family glycosyl hydrolase [Mycobacteriales bacterium]|jgi:alpha-glucosidase|nr:alpha-amylase family glycosyl hydrolase [Mycobacteriales bacterium]
MSTSWVQDAVVYEVYLRSYADSNGDGVGDLAGLRSRLPYLADLGVDAVWVTPFYPSPMADHGYDVADPMGVEPVFGDLADVDALLADAHRLGLRVLVDVVPNHTSSAHPWFAAALADPDSPMRERFVFRPGRGDGPPNDWQSTFGGPAWTQVPDGAWYLHLFDVEQPDLDWTCPAVHAYWLEVLRFWLDRGVDGFRIDVAHALYKRPDLADEGPLPEPVPGVPHERRHVWDRDEVLAVYEDWRQVTDAYSPERMMVGEVFLYDVARIARYVGPHGLHQAFNFTLMRCAYDAGELAAAVADALRSFALPTWVLSNHDLVRHVTRYGGGELGIRRGLSVTALLLALPGSPYLYQGEELGLEETEVPPDRRQDPVWARSGHTVAGRDGCRTPMPWRAGMPGLGFTTGQPWLPFGPDAEGKAVEPGPPALATYRSLLALRRSLLPGLGRQAGLLDAPEGVVAVHREGGLVAVLNTLGEDVEVPVAAERLLTATAPGAQLAGGLLTLPAASTAWLRAGG